MAATSRRVLVLEDSVLVAMMIEDELVDRGHAVTSAGSVASARACLAERTFDAALLDLHLPDGHSHDIARLLENAGCAVALVSGADTDAVPPELAHLPSFQKPVPPHVLGDWIDSLA